MLCVLLVPGCILKGGLVLSGGGPGLGGKPVLDDGADAAVLIGDGGEKVACGEVHLGGWRAGGPTCRSPVGLAWWFGGPTCQPSVGVAWWLGGPTCWYSVGMSDPLSLLHFLECFFLCCLCFFKARRRLSYLSSLESLVEVEGLLAFLFFEDLYFRALLSNSEEELTVSSRQYFECLFFFFKCFGFSPLFLLKSELLLLRLDSFSSRKESDDELLGLRLHLVLRSD